MTYSMLDHCKWRVRGAGCDDEMRVAQANLDCALVVDAMTEVELTAVCERYAASEKLRAAPATEPEPGAWAVAKPALTLSQMLQQWQWHRQIQRWRQDENERWQLLQQQQRQQWQQELEQRHQQQLLRQQQIQQQLVLHKPTFVVLHGHGMSREPSDVWKLGEPIQGYCGPTHLVRCEMCMCTMINPPEGDRFCMQCVPPGTRVMVFFKRRT